MGLAVKMYVCAKIINVCSFSCKYGWFFYSFKGGRLLRRLQPLAAQILSGNCLPDEGRLLPPNARAAVQSAAAIAAGGAFFL
jgi:hypothetical protein